MIWVLSLIAVLCTAGLIHRKMRYLDDWEMYFYAAVCCLLIGLGVTGGLACAYDQVTPYSNCSVSSKGELLIDDSSPHKVAIAQTRNWFSWKTMYIYLLEEGSERHTYRTKSKLTQDLLLKSDNDTVQQSLLNTLVR